MTTPNPVAPSRSSGERRIQAIGGLLLLLMGVAAIAVLTLGWRAARLNRSVEELSQTRHALNEELTTLKVGVDDSRSEFQKLEADTRKLDEQRVQLQAQVDLLNQTLATVKRSAPQQAAAAERSAQLRPRVYIQVASDDTAKEAEDLARQLRDAGYLVPRIERVRAVPRQPQIRYFDRGDAELANQILRIVSAMRPQATTVLFPGADPTRMREQHIEVWF